MLLQQRCLLSGFLELVLQQWDLYGLVPKVIYFTLQHGDLFASIIQLALQNGNLYTILPSIVGLPLQVGHQCGRLCWLLLGFFQLPLQARDAIQRIF